MFYIIFFILILLAIIYRTSIKQIVTRIAAWCAALNKGTSENATLAQRWYYFLQRHLVLVLLLSLSLVVMWLLSSIDDATIKAVTETIALIALRMSAFILVLKFTFPKLEVQNAATKNDFVLCALILAVAWIIAK